MRPEQALHVICDIADNGFGETAVTVAERKEMLRQAADVFKTTVAAHDAAIDAMRDASVLAGEARDRLATPLAAFEEADQ